jgi:hypothetical protein
VVEAKKWLFYIHGVPAAKTWQEGDPFTSWPTMENSFPRIFPLETGFVICSSQKSSACGQLREVH